MAAAAKFCPKCGNPAAKTVDVGSNRWTRSAAEFAVRIDMAAQQNAGAFVIEQGTRALLFQNGVCKGETPAGRYDRAGFFKQAGGMTVDNGTVVVLVDAGDVTLDLENGNLHSSDGFELGMRSRLVVRIKDPDAMYLNLMKGRATVRVSDSPANDDLESELAGEVQMILRSAVSAHPADELDGSLQLRGEFEERLRDSLSTTLNRLGLELIQLRFLGLEGERYTKLRAQEMAAAVAGREGEAAINQARAEQRVAEAGAGISADRAKLNQRLRQTLTQEKMDSLRNEAELELFVRQTEHDLGLKGTVREDEMERLKERFKFDRDRDGVLRRIEIAGMLVAEQREQALKQLQSEEQLRDAQLAADLRRRLETARAESDRRKIEMELDRLEHAEQLRRAEAEMTAGRLAHAEQMRRAGAEEEFAQKKARSAIDMLKQVKELEAEEDRRDLEIEEKKLAARSHASIAALISVVDGDAREVLLRLEQRRIEGAMTPEQVLAEAAKTSPEAAKALAQKFQSEGLLTAKAAEERAALLERQIAEQRQMSDGYADRMERLMNTALDKMGGVASTRAQAPSSPTIVTGGGAAAAQPVVVASHAAAAGRCRHCGASLDANAAFCGECGKKQ
jgi:hypothetical protein